MFGDFDVVNAPSKNRTRIYCSCGGGMRQRVVTMVTTSTLFSPEK